MSRTRLGAERMLGIAAGSLAVAIGGIGGLATGAWLADLTLLSAGLLRAGLLVVLVALAAGGVGAATAALLPRGAVVPVLSAWIAGSYLVVVSAQLFGWPEWSVRLSFFNAAGEPYLRWPDLPGLALLGVMALGGSLLARLAEPR